MKIIQSRNQREGGFNGLVGVFKGATRFARSKKTSLKARRKEKRDWERKLAGAKSPEERSAMIQSRAYNHAVEQQSSLGDAFFPVKK